MSGRGGPDYFRYKTMDSAMPESAAPVVTRRGDQKNAVVTSAPLTLNPIEAFFRALLGGRQQSPSSDIDIENIKKALAHNESRGWPDPYLALGPKIKKGRYKGDHAYGKYQVMGLNVPEWTEHYLGKRMTPQEFLHDRDAQERLTELIIIEKVNEARAWGVDPAKHFLSKWFTGHAYTKAVLRLSDGYSTGGQYINRGVAKLEELRGNTAALKVATAEPYDHHSSAGSPRGKHHIHIAARKGKVRTLAAARHAPAPKAS